MDLPAVKALVKSWEKAFKAQHGRDPTKHDIKQDPSGIAEKYALYRQLSKAAGAGPSSQSESQGQYRLPSSSSATSSSHGESSRQAATPQVVPASQHCMTPTPPARRRSSAGTALHPSEVVGNDSAPSRDLKRTASKAALRPGPPSPPPLASSPQPSFITPKKSRPTYSGPVFDPHPLNPFASPSKSASRPLEATSPFIHASSPRKLKEVIQANSLRKIRERESVKAEITPRTRARKRLKGEWVEDTPVKDKAPRRKRGEGRPVVEGGGGRKGSLEISSRDEAIQGRASIVDRDRLAVEADGSEDELGPSPVKRPAGMLRTFTELLEGSENHSVPTGKKNGISVARRRSSHGKSSDDSPFTDDKMGKRRMNTVSPAMDVSAKSSSSDAEASLSIEQDDHLVSLMSPSPPVETLPPPSPDPVIAADPPASTSTPFKVRRTKMLSLSDDEIDEWDPEAGPIRHQVIITGTRRAPIARGDSGENEAEAASDRETEAEEEGDDDDDDGPPPLVEGTTATSPSSPSSASLAPPLLSVLSLHSPSRKRQTQMTDLRVKAIFNPRDATRLKALRKGQEIFVSGEAEDGQDDDTVMEKYEVGVVGDESGQGVDELHERDAVPRVIYAGRVDTGRSVRGERVGIGRIVWLGKGDIGVCVRGSEQGEWLGGGQTVVADGAGRRYRRRSRDDSVEVGQARDGGWTRRARCRTRNSAKGRVAGFIRRRLVEVGGLHWYSAGAKCGPG